MSAGCEICRVIENCPSQEVLQETQDYLVLPASHIGKLKGFVVVPRRHISGGKDLQDIADVELLGGLLLFTKQVAQKQNIDSNAIQLQLGEGHIYFHIKTA